MLPYYIVNTMEIIFGIFFLVAAFKFLTKKTDDKRYKILGVAYIAISVLSFTALGISVQESGIVL